jgi:hypothetical protein
MDSLVLTFLIAIANTNTIGLQIHMVIRGKGCKNQKNASM